MIHLRQGFGGLTGDNLVSVCSDLGHHIDIAPTDASVEVLNITSEVHVGDYIIVFMARVVNHDQTVGFPDTNYGQCADTAGNLYLGATAGSFAGDPQGTGAGAFCLTPGGVGGITLYDYCVQYVRSSAAMFPGDQIAVTVNPGGVCNTSHWLMCAIVTPGILEARNPVGFANWSEQRATSLNFGFPPYETKWTDFQLPGVFPYQPNWNFAYNLTVIWLVALGSVPGIPPVFNPGSAGQNYDIISGAENFLSMFVWAYDGTGPIYPDAGNDGPIPPFNVETYYNALVPVQTIAAHGWMKFGFTPDITPIVLQGFPSVVPAAVACARKFCSLPWYG